MVETDYGQTWYHGSQQRLTTLRAGNSITQNRDVAKAFSHRPSKVSMSYVGEGEPQPDEWNVKHDGVMPGFLPIVSEQIGPADVSPHPHPSNASRFEWLCHRDLKLELIEETIVTSGERLSEEEIATVERRQREKGDLSFLESSE